MKKGNAKSLTLLLVLAIVVSFGSCSMEPDFEPSDQEITRTMSAFAQAMSTDEPPEGVEVTYSDNGFQADFENVTTVYSGNTYSFDGFMDITMEDDNSGSYDMELTASSNSLDGDIVIDLSFSFDSEGNPTINTYTINGVDYSGEAEDALGMMPSIK